MLPASVRPVPDGLQPLACGLPRIHIDPNETTPITQSERAQIAAWLSAWLSGRCATLATACGPRSRSDFARAQRLLLEARAHYAKALARGARYWCPGVLLCAAQAGMLAGEAVRLAGLRIAEYQPKSKRKAHEIKTRPRTPCA